MAMGTTKFSNHVWVLRFEKCNPSGILPSRIVILASPELEDEELLELDVDDEELVEEVDVELVEELEDPVSLELPLPLQPARTTEARISELIKPFFIAIISLFSHKKVVI
jgi:hypothetical protein